MLCRFEYYSPFSTNVLLPNDQAGEFVSLKGLFLGVYAHAVGPSISILNGGRADIASSHVTTFLGRYIIST